MTIASIFTIDITFAIIVQKYEHPPSKKRKKKRKKEEFALRDEP